MQQHSNLPPAHEFMQARMHRPVCSSTLPWHRGWMSVLLSMVHKYLVDYWKWTPFLEWAHDSTTSDWYPNCRCIQWGGVGLGQREGVRVCKWVFHKHQRSKVCCSVLQSVAGYYSVVVMQSVAVCCSVLQYVAVCYNVLHCSSCIIQLIPWAQLIPWLKFRAFRLIWGGYD